MRHSMCVAVLLAAIAGPQACAQRRAVGEEDKAYWGVEGSAGYAWIPKVLIERQDRYSASVDGMAYTAGLVRFHRNGAPSFSLQMCRATLNGKANELRGLGFRYEGSATITGFMATKHLNILARRRFSTGFSFGIGVAPQLEARYKQIITRAGVVSTTEKTYKLKEIPVTPLFEVLVRADVRVARNLSIGPFGGIRTGVPVAGGAVRVHFLP